MRRYENRSTMMTSNRPLEDWGKLIGDVPSATAILDRFLHHAEIITITGKSYRLKDRTEPNKPAKPEKGLPRTESNGQSLGSSPDPGILGMPPVFEGEEKAPPVSRAGGAFDAPSAELSLVGLGSRRAWLRFTKRRDCKRGTLRPAR